MCLASLLEVMVSWFCEIVFVVIQLGWAENAALRGLGLVGDEEMWL